MKSLIERSNRLLALPLRAGPRVLLLFATLPLLLVFMFPLWKMMVFAPRHPDGLRLSIYSDRLESGNRGQDLREIDILSRDIGGKGLSPGDPAESPWMPFVVGALALLFLRCAVLGEVSSLVDVFVLDLYFCLFSLWSFAAKLYHYGHSLSPAAPAEVTSFLPPLFGHTKVANLDISSFPAEGSYALGAVTLLLAVAVLWAWRQGRKTLVEEARAAG